MRARELTVSVTAGPMEMPAPRRLIGVGRPLTRAAEGQARGHATAYCGPPPPPLRARVGIRVARVAVVAARRPAVKSAGCARRRARPPSDDE